MKGKAFNLTDKRIKEVLRLLSMQHTVGSIAFKFGITRSVLSTKLGEAGIDSKAIRNAGRVDMRSMLFESILNIKDDNRRAEAGLKYLDRFPVQEDDDDTQDEVDTASIKIEIMTELQGK